LLHIGIMLLLLFFVYAVAGMALFGDIQVHGNEELSGMSQDVNFQSFYLAMVMLFRISTGESWNSLMHDCFSGANCSEPPHRKECGNTGIAVFFFVSFMIIGSFVFVNLFIAVIIEKLFECEEDDGTDDMSVMAKDLESFVEAWARISPDGSSYIPTVHLPALLQDVDPPLGFNGQVMRRSTVIRCVARLGIRDHGGKVHFVETLWRLASMVVGADMRNVQGNNFLKNINAMVIRAWPLPLNHNKHRGQEGVLYLAAQVIVAARIQSLWRAQRARKRFFEAVKTLTESSRLAAWEKNALEDGGLGFVNPSIGEQWLASASPTLEKVDKSEVEHQSTRKRLEQLEVELADIAAREAAQDLANSITEETTLTKSTSETLPIKEQPGRFADTSLPMVPPTVPQAVKLDASWTVSKGTQETRPEQPWDTSQGGSGRLVVPPALPIRTQAPAPSLISAVLSSCGGGNTAPACTTTGCARTPSACVLNKHSTPPCELTIASEDTDGVSATNTSMQNIMNVPWDTGDGPYILDLDAPGLSGNAPVQHLSILESGPIWEDDLIPGDRSGNGPPDELPPPSAHPSTKRQLLVL